MSQLAAAFGRLLPRRLASQMIVLLLLALVLSQAASLWVFLGERREVVESATAEQVLLRVASVVWLIEETPPALHRRVVRAANAPLLRFGLSSDSAIAGRLSQRRDETLRGRLSAMLEGSSARGVDVALARGLDAYGGPSIGAAFDRRRSREQPEDHDEEDDADRFHRWRDDDHQQWTPRLLGLIVSVELADGRWLNARSAVPVPPPVWALPSLLSMALMAAALIVIVVLMIRRLARPLDRLAEAAGRLGRGETVEPVAEEGPLDLRRTIRAFNGMNERLQRFVRDRTTMLAAISHDLRTPITALRLRAELIEDPEARSKIVETLDEMQQMAEATLAFAREEANREDSRTVDLAALVDSLCQDLSEMGLPVSFTGDERVPFICRPVALKRALRNLIENAVAYGGEASARLESTKAEVRILVEDHGPGIPAADRERVFAPFVRLEESRSRDTGGIGLGMAIARTIVRSHGGDIDLADRPEGGLRVTVHLPRPER